MGITLGSTLGTTVGGVLSFLLAGVTVETPLLSTGLEFALLLLSATAIGLSRSSLETSLFLQNY